MSRPTTDDPEPKPTTEPTPAPQPCCLVREPTELELAQLENARLRAFAADVASDNRKLENYILVGLGAVYGFCLARWLFK